MKNKLTWFAGTLALIGAGVMYYQSRKTSPVKAEAVSPFDVKRYLGKWFEIARFDYRFERNMNNVTAVYSPAEDGEIRVVNRGFHTKNREWKQAEGKAKFVGAEDEARLKVSFFGPFYSGYNVVAIDEAYRYALVTGENLNYLWILSREKTIPEDVKARYLERAEAIGYDTGKLIWVKHD